MQQLVHTIFPQNTLGEKTLLFFPPVFDFHAFDQFGEIWLD